MALEVTDLAESKLLLYFCRINWAQDRLLMDYRAPALLPLCPNNLSFHQSSEPQLGETISEKIENNTRRKVRNLGGNTLSLYDFQKENTEKV